MIRPMLTALNETMAKAMVMEADGCVVLGLSGPHSSTERAVTASTNPVTTQRMICGRLTIFVPGLRGGRCITPGSGTSTMNPITTVMTTKNLQNTGSAKIPAPTIDPTPMNAAWRTFRCLTSAGADTPSAASDIAGGPFLRDHIRAGYSRHDGGDIVQRADG